jgi:hypothetical protein
MAGSSEHGDKLSGYKKIRQLMDQLSKYQHFKENPAPWEMCYMLG